VFEVAIVIGIIGIILFATVWNAPANGYAKAEPIIEQVKAEFEASRKE
jgi:hypothetical protein